MATDFYEIWDRYHKSKSYMDSKNMVYKTEKNWLMYAGKQWEAVEDSKGMEDLPMLNFIKPTVKYKVSSIAATTVTAMFSDLNSENTDAVSRLNKLFDISWDKSKMKKNSKTGLRYAAVEGDSYFFWGEGGDTRKEPQILHKTSVRLGDENIENIQEQPWIIIEERMLPEVVRERARRNGIKKEDIDLIKPDKELSEVLINKNEVDGKVTSLLYMEKDAKTGIVWAGRCTPSVMYEEFKPIQQTRGGEYIDVGLKMYPIVPMLWETMPNDARGMSEVEQLIPNQLETNKTLA